MKKGFTLSEIMIALVVIGVITSILLPVAFNNVPNENVMKFKKGNATLAKIINELVTSGEYYTPGDLGIKKDGSLVEDYKYFCNTICEIITIKEKNCSSNISPEVYGEHIVQLGSEYGVDLNEAKEILDKTCKKYEPIIKSEIILPDGIVLYQTHPNYPFGMKYKNALKNSGNEANRNYCSNNPNMDICQENFRLFNSGYFFDENGFDRIYKVFCMDVDGINQGEAPFGYGIRADGKIILGNRAQEWIEKSIQEK